MGSSNEYALILEDDAQFTYSHRLRGLLESSIGTMIANQVDVLQVGFVTRDSLLEKIKTLLYWTFRHISIVKKFYPWLAKNSFWPGTHAYILNRRAAEALASFSGPIWLAADALLMSFADSMQHYSQFCVARVRISLVGQKPVSDVNQSDVQR